MVTLKKDQKQLVQRCRQFSLFAFCIVVILIFGIFSHNVGDMGIDFTIPSNIATLIKHQLIKPYGITQCYLGIIIQDLTPELSKAFCPDDSKGVLIAEVTKNSPAEKSGLKPGDVIVEFGGKQVQNVAEFRQALTQNKGKESIRLRVKDGKYSHYIALSFKN